MLASLLVTAAACSPGRFSVEGACVAQAKAICSFQYNCCNASERHDAFDMAQSAPYDDESTCVEVNTRTLCGDDRAVGSVDAERAVWDETKAEECYKPLYTALEACDAKTAFSFKANSAECKAILVGKVSNNGTCFEGYECATKGAICEPKDSPNPMTPLITSEGTCVPPAALGQSCAMKACAPDLYCDFATTNCAALKADNAACMGSQECQSKNCVQGGTGGMCGAKKANGQPCMGDSECQSDVCDPITNTCSGMGGVMPVYDICLGKNK